MYQVNYYQSGRYATSERFRTLKEARKACVEYIDDLRETLTSARGFVRVGNIRRDNRLMIEHKAFGHEASAYIERV